MDTLSYKTRSAKKNELQKEWYLIDAENEIVGRLATQVALLLRGKRKTLYTPNLDCGDNVIIINAEKVKFTGKKLTDKEYVRHTGYPGGQRFATPAELLKRKPEAILEYAIRGMLPHNKLGDELYRSLYVYSGTEHPHQGQNPKVIKLSSIR
jgi:large subunit ribosomal protein L13